MKRCPAVAATLTARERSLRLPPPAVGRWSCSRSPSRVPSPGPPNAKVLLYSLYPGKN